MKHQISTLALLIVGFTTIIAQTSQNVKTNGNTLTQGEYIGSNNNEDLVVKTNGSNNTIFKKNGEVKMTSLQGTGNRLVYATDNGVLATYPFGQPGQLLTADGVWIDPPANYWQVSNNGNRIWTSMNKVGINMNNQPAFTLDVNGDGHFTGNLVLNGELIINEKITSPKQLTTAKIFADSIMMGSGKAIFGETTVKGDVKLKYTLDVTGDATFNGNQNIAGTVNVSGNEYVNGRVNASQGLTFDGLNGIKFVAGNNGTGNFIYGKVALPPPPIQFCAANPQAWANHQFGGMMQIYNVDQNGQYIPGHGLLNFQTWEGGSSIDASIGGTNATGGLLLNYFCENNTYINTNNGLPNRGGNVYMGEHVSMARYVGIGNNGGNPSFSETTALNIFANEDNQTALKLNVWNGTVKAIDLVNPGNDISNFVVWQNGKTQIGSDHPVPGTGHDNAMLIVGGNGKIACKELYVIKPANWADFVFENGYKLLPLSEVEQYYKLNKHLPGVPSESEVESNGLNAGEMDATLLKKIEELTIYMVELKKEIEQLKDKLKNN